MQNRGLYSLGRMNFAMSFHHASSSPSELLNNMRRQVLDQDLQLRLFTGNNEAHVVGYSHPLSLRCLPLAFTSGEKG